jgi:peptidoglycan/LPS O-acetylase OafA/YrhL
VLVFHAFPGALHGGFTGVDVFFVISGFLISSLIWEGLEAGSFSLTRFYARRIARLFPALMIVLAASLALGWWLFLPTEFATLGKDVAAAAVYISNFVLWRDAGYFTPAAGERPLTHLWSLGVEEQYYLFYPLLLIAAFRSRRLTATLIAALLAASFAENVATVHAHAAAAFYLLPARLWELMLGGGLAYLARRHHAEEREVDARLINAASAVGLALLVVAFAGPGPSSEFPGWWALAPTGAAVLLIGAGPRSFVSRRVFSLRPVVFVGQISYPLYLWHFPLLVFARAYRGDNLSVLERVVVLALSAVLAYATYRVLEQPVRRSVRRRTTWLVRTLVPALAIVGCLGLSLFVEGGMPGRFPPELGQLSSFTFDFKTAYRMGSCFLDPDQGPSAFHPSCVDPGRGRLVLLWGDSHAAHLYPGLSALAHTRSFRIAEYTAGSCPPILSYTSAAWPKCHPVNAWVRNRVRVLRPDTVILAAAWQLPVEGLRETFRALRSSGVRRIVVVGPTPVWEKPVPQVLYEQFRTQHLKRLPIRTRSELGDLDDVNEALHALTASSGVGYVDSLHTLCNRRGCLVRLGDRLDQLMFWDSSHLTRSGSRYFVKHIADQLLGQR